MELRVYGQVSGGKNANTRKNLNNWTVCYGVQNSLLWKGGQKHSKNTAKTRPLPLPPPSETEEKIKIS